MFHISCNFLPANWISDIKMSEVNGSGGGPGPPPSQPSPKPDQFARTSTWVEASVSGGQNTKLRSFAEIIEEEKANRNILEIKMHKINSVEEEI